MSSKKIILYPNRDTGWYCVSAVLMSIYEFLLDEKKDWDFFDKLMMTKVGKSTWTFPAYIDLVKRGVEVYNLEPFNYLKFEKKGYDYVRDALSENVSKEIQEHTNMDSVSKFIPEFNKLVRHETVTPTTESIDKMIEDGFLVGVMLNKSVLLEEEGNKPHFVLVIAKEGDAFIVNDPGLPPMQRKISKSLMTKAMGETPEVTGFKKK